MPQRVTDLDVKAIMDTEVNTTPFIVAASLQVDHYAPLAGWSTALAKEIERWWAAHNVCARDPRFAQIKTEGDAFTYAMGKLGEGLKSTPYGQQVLAMDPSGILAQATMQQPASFRVD